MKGKFITIEGGEGTGKSTQNRLLCEYLQTKEIKSVVTKEPGGTDVGIELRRLLVTGDVDKFDHIAEVLLYYADRRIHLTKKVWPAMERGEWVVSDRYADSTMAYQYYGYGKRISKEDLAGLYDIVAGDFLPDLTLILDIDPKIGLERSMSKAGQMMFKEIRFESRELEFHYNMRNGFLEIAKDNPSRCVVLDANKTIEELHKDIVELVNERFGLNA